MERLKYIYRVAKHEARVYCDNTGSIGTPPVSCDYKQSMSRLLKITVGPFAHCIRITTFGLLPIISCFQ